MAKAEADCFGSIATGVCEDLFDPWFINPTQEQLNRCNQMNGAIATTASSVSFCPGT
jgi:hypothetical protein